MERFEIQPVRSSALPDAADFLRRWRGNLAGEPHYRVTEGSASIERRLRWLLLENPAVSEGAPLGFCVRDSLGIIRGLNLSFPAAFLAGDQWLLGLGSGSFFVEPEARSMGFYLFKKYLASRGHSFFFSTTCNASSGELWGKLGGRAVPGSETEYVLPLRLDVVIPEFLATRTSQRAALEIARICGRVANPLLRMLTRGLSQLTIEPCEDWEKLAELSRRHRSHDIITPDRSAEFLEWRYGPSSPLYSCSVYLFRDMQGNEGWFSLGNLLRGEQGQLRGSVLLDAVWPREKMSFGQIFSEIPRLAAAGSDAIFFRSQPGLDYREFNRCVVPYKLAAPRVFVMTAKGAAPLALGSLDYDDSDFGAWKFQWQACASNRCLEPARVGVA
jgi:hypothetical protein